MSNSSVAKLKARYAKRQAMQSQKLLTDNELAEQLKTSGDKLFDTKEWKDLKRQVHEKYGYVCMKCKRLPYSFRNVCVDHIKPRKWFPELALCFENLQVLCSRCNKAKGNKTISDYRPKVAA